MATEPESPLTIWQRLLADSPAFWKKVNYVGLALGAIVAAIQTNVPTFPKTWLGLMAGISVGLVAASQFAVKDTTALAKPDATIQDYINLAGDLQKQYAEVKSSIEATVNKINNPGATIEKTPVDKDAPPNAILPLDQTGPIDLSNKGIPTATLISSTPAPQPGSDISDPNLSGQ